MINRRRFIELAAAAALAPEFIANAFAQPWPNRFARIIVPFGAGAPPDVTARLIAARLADMWGQQVVVENKPGAGGNIGMEAAARSAPDGYTVLMAAFTLAVNSFLYRSTGYDPVVDFAPVTLVSLQPCVMMVPNSSPVHSVEEFIAYAKANKGRITYASGGHGTAPHLAGELFKRMTGIEMTHVPYRSGATQDLVAGRVDVMFAVTNFALITAGQARGLAVTGAKRVAAAPDLPTVAEAGVPGFDVSTWWGFFVPASTAPEIVDRINVDTVAVLANPAVREKMDQLGVTPIGSTAGELSRHLKAEMAKWEAVIREAGITIDG